MTPEKLAEFLAATFTEWLDKIEHAVDAHDKLVRFRHGTGYEERATMSVDRHISDGTTYWTAGIQVRLKHQRKMSHYHESADTPEEAVEKLIKNFDIWAKAIDK